MQNKISIMHITYSLDIGGSEILAFNIASRLNRNLFHTSICALDRGGALIEDLQQNNIDYHVLLRKGVEAGVFKRIYKLIRENKIDIIHTHHFTQLFYSAIPARLAGVKIIHTEHEYFTYLDSKFGRVCLKPLVRLCKKFTTVGPEISDYFINRIGIPGDRIKVVPNGIDVEKFDVKSDAIRNECKLREDEVVFGIVGRLEKEKDHKALFDAFKLVERKVPQIKLLVIGGGSLKEDLEAYVENIGISQKVHFLGCRKDIPEILSAIDIFVMSSINEGLPISIVEAMAARKPVISTDVGSIKHLVKQGINGLLVPPKDTTLMEKAMLRLITNPGLQKEMGVRGHEMAVDSFSLSKMLQQYEDLYCSVYNNNKLR